VQVSRNGKLAENDLLGLSERSLSERSLNLSGISNIIPDVANRVIGLRLLEPSVL
jgi:hypothetical protein